MKAIKPIQEGEEIFNDYGEIPRADLLRRYGYVTDNYAPFDVIELSLGDICQAAGLSNSDVEAQPRVCIGTSFMYTHMARSSSQPNTHPSSNSSTSTISLMTAT